MKILSISSTDIWPFGENIGIPSIYASQKGFADKGHKVYFLCPMRKKGLPLEQEYHGVYIYRFGLPFSISSLSVYALSLRNIWTRLRSTIVFNLEWLFFQIFSLVYGIKLARRMRPSLIYAHGLVSALPSYLVSILSKSKLVIRVYGARDLYWKWESPWFRLKEFRDYLSFKIPADYLIITNDGNYADRLALRLGVQQEKIRCWRNGVDFSIYGPNPQSKKEILKEFRIDPSAKIIISTSRLLYLYGLDRLVFALPEVFKKSENAICIFAGTGPERKDLEVFAYKHGIQKKVFFLGMIDHERLKRLLNAADIFVLLSRYHNCTNTMWEAMVCGKCIVTTETEAIKEVLTSGVNCILLPEEKMNELAKVLEELLANDGLRLRLGENARIRAKEILETWPERIDKEIALLEKLVSL